MMSDDVYYIELKKRMHVEALKGHCLGMRLPRGVCAVSFMMLPKIV